MKRKIMVIAVIGFFIGAGVVPSISGNQTYLINPEDELMGLQPKLEATARCGWGILVTIKNVGGETFQDDITCTFDIDASSLTVISRNSMTFSNYTLVPGGWLAYRVRVLGFGPATISMDLDYGQGVMTGDTTGYMILSFIIGAEPIIIT